MSAIPGLLRVMTLRDAEAIILETGKVPTLRRRGALEALAMPALEAKLLEDFVAPLVAGREFPTTVTFADDGGSYQCTIDKTSAGLRIVAKPGKPKAADKAPPAGLHPAADDKPRAWWAKPAAPVAPSAEPTVVAPSAQPTVVEPIDTTLDGLAHAAHLLAHAVAMGRERGASDVLLSTGQTPRLRIDGRIETLDVHIDDHELAACVRALGSNTDHSLEIDGVRVRVNAFDHLAGFGLAARLIRERVPTLESLSLPPELASVIEHRDGLVLVCGSTGSGKSTTLAALIDLVDQRRAAHIITLEDPIEYRFTPRRSLIHQRELGAHIPTFAAGLRAALREAPDVILLGEMRDQETIATALTAAETGHLVLATLHAPNAAGAIDRIIDAFPDGQQRQVRWQLAGVLRNVITQYLLPRRDGGRVAAVEFVPMTPAVGNIIRKGDLHTLPTAIQSGRDAGMIPLERTLAKLLDGGIVAPQVVKRVAADQDLLSALASKLR
jgi:twitching motility protein PilT